ncbi:MAG: ATP-dependent Clp protease proteolytic subunit [Nanoarchaeota archaeon]|nr:ATP-dependent Clp protease proteolytic subunit [Nanoarchaeota archaeon]
MVKRKSGIRYSQNDIENYFDLGFDKKKRILYMGSFGCPGESGENGVDNMMAEFFIKGLDVLNASGRKITVKMNNPGGDWLHGMAIYDAIRDSKAPVDIEVYGHAMSMGAVILQAGRKRLLHPNAAVMIHDGTTSNEGMPIRSAKNWAEFESWGCKRMYEIFASRSGRYPHYWKKKCSHDHIYTAEQAIKEGLADAIIEPTRQIPYIKPTKKTNGR